MEASFAFCFSVHGDVAFYAILTEPSNLPEGSIVVYDQVYVNEGNGYQAGSGTFTAFSHGIYQFTLFFHTWGKEYKLDYFLAWLANLQIA